MARVEIPDSVLKKPRGTLCPVQLGSEVIIFLREDDWGLRNYPLRDCAVDVRLGVWNVEGVMLAALVVRLARSDKTTFDHQFDLSEPESVRLLQCLAVQPHLDVHIITTGVSRTFRINNVIQFDASYIVDKVRSKRDWTPEVYRSAMNRLNTLYPTPSAMWRNCGDQVAT